MFFTVIRGLNCRLKGTVISFCRSVSTSSALLFSDLEAVFDHSAHRSALEEMFLELTVPLAWKQLHRH